jgi:hypothetical protein
VCVLLISWNPRRRIPLVLAANRDEAYARPSTLPESVRTAHDQVLAPRDRIAGGTWIGIASSGLVAAITNRRDGDFDARRPSRGLLCRRALELADARAVRRFLEQEMRERRTNSFNLFYADRSHAWATSWNGALATVELRPGSWVLSNEHGVGEIEPPRLGPLLTDDPDFTELRTALRGFLARHDPEPRSGLVICKHGEDDGTVSSTLVFLPAGQPGWLEHAPGPPCSTEFVTSALYGAAPVP